jgi:hypothetical protein
MRVAITAHGTRACRCTTREPAAEQTNTTPANTALHQSSRRDLSVFDPPVLGIDE